MHCEVLVYNSIRLSIVVLFVVNFDDRKVAPEVEVDVVLWENEQKRQVRHCGSTKLDREAHVRNRTARILAFSFTAPRQRPGAYRGGMASETEIYFPDTLPFPIKVLSLAVRATETVTSGNRLLNYSFLHTPGGNVKESQTHFGSWDATFDGEVRRWNVKVGDVVTRQRAKERHAVLIAEECSHGIQVNGLCAVCGMDMEKCVSPIPTI